MNKKADSEFISVENPEFTCFSQNQDNLDYLLKKFSPLSPKESKHLVVFSTKHRPYYRYVYGFYSYALYKSGIPSLFLYDDDQIKNHFPNLRVGNKKLTHTLRDYTIYLQHNDPKKPPGSKFHAKFGINRIWIENYENINLYYPFLSARRRQEKRYQVDLQNKTCKKKLIQFFCSAECIFTMLDRLKQFGEKHNKTIFIVGWDSNLPPSSLYYEYTKTLNETDLINYIDLGVQYNSYFTGDPESLGNSIGSSNLTRRDGYNPLSTFKKEFNKFTKKVSESNPLAESIQNEIDGDMHSIILDTYNHSIKDTDHFSRKKKRKSLINQAKEDNNNIYCLFSHVFDDLPARDSSPVFTDMLDWIDFTINSFSERDDLLLLKPHPDEVDRSEDEIIVNEQLKDYVHEKIASYENILLLEPTEFSAAEIYDFISAGLVWRSSVGMEMLYMDIPVVFSATPYYLNYLEINPMPSREAYKEQILDPENINPADNLKEQVRICLYFLKNHLHVNFPYIKDADFTLNGWNMDITWNKEKLEEYLKEGDTAVENLLLREIKYDMESESYETLPQS